MSFWLTIQLICIHQYSQTKRHQQIVSLYIDFFVGLLFMSSIACYLQSISKNFFCLTKSWYVSDIISYIEIFIIYYVEYICTTMMQLSISGVNVYLGCICTKILSKACFQKLLTVHSDARSLQLAIMRSEYLLIRPSLGEPFENFRDIL